MDVDKVLVLLEDQGSGDDQFRESVRRVRVKVGTNASCHCMSRQFCEPNIYRTSEGKVIREAESEKIKLVIEGL